MRSRYTIIGSRLSDDESSSSLKNCFSDVRRFRCISFSTGASGLLSQPAAQQFPLLQDYHLCFEHFGSGVRL